MDIESIDSLCQALEEHLNRHRTLVEHLSRENECLMNANADELLLESMLRERAAQAIQDGTVNYLTAFKRTAEALDLPFSPPPLLTDLAALVPQPFRDRLKAGSAELARLKNIIFRDNEVNYHYIEEALRLVTANLAALTCSGNRAGRPDLI